MPAAVEAGRVDDGLSKEDGRAGAEAGLRRGYGAYSRDEQENLISGLSGGLSLNIQPGSYKSTCPGASASTSDLTVTAKATASKSSTS